VLSTVSSDVPVRAGLDDADGDGEAQARLDLLERLLASSDLRESAQHAIDWLAEQGRVDWSVCLVVDAAGTRLVPLADHGLPPSSVSEFMVRLDEPGHPLVRALRAADASHVGVERPAGPTPPGGPFHAFPLRARGAETLDAAGLLVTAAPDRAIDDRVRWLAGVLGDRAVRLRPRESTGDARSVPERALLQGILNAVTDPILLTDAEGRLVIGNAAAESLLRAPELASEGWRQAVNLNHTLFSAALPAEALDAPSRPAQRELVLVDPSEGSELLFEMTSTPLRDRRDDAPIVSVLRNVTDLGRAGQELDESYRQLRVAQAAVRDQRRRLDLVINSVADPIVVSDPSGAIVLMNTRAERLFRVGGDEPDATRRRAQTNNARFSSLVSTLLSSGHAEDWRGETTLIDPRIGRTRPMEAVAGTVLSETGELVWIVTILHDLTATVERARLYERVKRASVELEARVREATSELVRQNELLRRQRFEVEQASALKSQFLANMSHEFRTPLNCILGYTQLLLQGLGGAFTPEQRTDLARIDSNGRHLLALINDILDVSRIEAGRMPVDATVVGIPELVAEVLEELDPLIKQSRLSVSTRLSSRLPAIESDRRKVKQILFNLVSNALKFTKRGGVRVRARHAARRRTVLITVEDTGVGIPQADLERIFEDFRQLDPSPSRGYGGTGLGLSICRRLAGMLGGQVTVRSQVGAGSAFTLELPVRVSDG